MINYTSSKLRLFNGKLLINQREDKLWEMHFKALAEKDLPHLPEYKLTANRIKFENKIYPIWMGKTPDEIEFIRMKIIVPLSEKPSETTEIIIY